MRVLAIGLAVAYLVAAGLLLPGGNKHRVDHQVSVQTATVPAPAGKPAN